MDLQLKGRVAVVTGSTTGIGFAIGSGLASEGETVIINGRSERCVGDAIATIRQKHPQAKLEVCAGDLGTAATAQRAAGQFTHVDILINNLGLYDPKPFEAISDQDWQAIIETNFMSGVRLSRRYLPKMKGDELGKDHFYFQRIGDQYSG